LARSNRAVPAALRTFPERYDASRNVIRRITTVTDGLASIIAQLERQKTAIERALAALRDVDGRPADEPNVNTPATRKGGMTPEGKKRLIKALRKRWAAKKAAEQGSAGDASRKEAPAKRKSNFTPEGRKRLAEAMKRRWAVKRAASAVKKRARRPKKAA
jgi:hypothetical protein